MPRRSPFIFPSLIVLLACGGLTRAQTLPEVHAEAAPLLPNGDFQKANASGDWPEGWGVNPPGGGATWEAEDGKRFLRLVSQKPGQWQTLYRSVNLTPGKVRAIRVSVRYRTSGVRAGDQPGQDARAVFAFQDASGATLDPVAAPLVFAPARNWTEISGQMAVPENAAHLVFVTGLLHAAAGTVDVGEVAVRPMEAAEATAAPKGEEEASQPPWVKNGDFSQPDADGHWPADWGKAGPGMSWETGPEGRFVRLTVQEPGKSQMLNQTVPIPGGVKGIKLLIRWRAEGVQHGEHEWFDARTIVHFVGTDGQTMPTEGGDVVFTHKPEPTGWKKSVHSYQVPEGAKGLQLMLGLFKAKAGQVDLAEVRVMPMTDAAAEAQRITSTAYGAWKGAEDAAIDRRIGREIDAQLAATGNLVPNGGFGTQDKDGKPAEWGKQLQDGMSWVEEKGEHFMRLESHDPQKIRMLYRMVPLKLGIKEVEVVIRYRTVGVVKGEGTPAPGSARVAMHYLNGWRFGHMENGKEVTPGPGEIELPAEGADWTEVRQKYPVPEGATKLQFMPGLWYVKAGTLDLAEIRIVPSGEAGR